MSEKEQAQLLKLLHRWVEFEEAADAAASFEAVGAMLTQRQELLRETRELLTLRIPAPESHGQRRG